MDNNQIINTLVDYRATSCNLLKEKAELEKKIKELETKYNCQEEANRKLEQRQDALCSAVSQIVKNTNILNHQQLATQKLVREAEHGLQQSMKSISDKLSEMDKSMLQQLATQKLVREAEHGLQQSMKSISDKLSEMDKSQKSIRKRSLEQPVLRIERHPEIERMAKVIRLDDIKQEPQPEPTTEA